MIGRFYFGNDFFNDSVLINQETNTIGRKIRNCHDCTVSKGDASIGITKDSEGKTVFLFEL